MTPWVARLLFLNVVMYVLTLVVDGLDQALMFVPVEILSRPWTIITYQFIHDTHSIWHLLFNMFALYFFGPRVEARVGGRRFLGLYFTSGIMGGLLSFTSPMIGVIGASGAVYGVMFAYAHYWPREVVHIWGVLPVEVRWLVVGVTVFSLVSGFGGTGDGVAHFAHLGGFLGAFIYVRILDRVTGARRFRAQAVPSATRPSLEPSSAAVARWSRISRDTLHPVNREELDRVMAKIQRVGIGRLTPDERDFLERFSLRAGD